jgi:hypothetical protein
MILSDQEIKSHLAPWWGITPTESWRGDLAEFALAGQLTLPSLQGDPAVGRKSLLCDHIR